VERRYDIRPRRSDVTPLFLPSTSLSSDSSIQFQSESKDANDLITEELRVIPSVPFHPTSDHSLSPGPLERPDTPFVDIVRSKRRSAGPKFFQSSETLAGSWNRRDIRDVIKGLRALK